jgi:hypothetical protein
VEKETENGDKWLLIDSPEDSRKTIHAKRNCKIDSDKSSEHGESLCQNGTKKSQLLANIEEKRNFLRAFSKIVGRYQSFGKNSD